MKSNTLPSSPLYDPKAKVRNFKKDEDMTVIRQSLSGKEDLYEDLYFNYILEEVEDPSDGSLQPTEWKRPKEICSKPKFINFKPDRFDALQGRLGDCWVVSAMEALTLNDQLIQHVVPPYQYFDDNYVGAFHFRIWNLGVWYDVVVDDRLPVYKKNKKLCYCWSRSGDVFWAALLEKAYAKFWVTNKISYDVLDAGNYSTSFISFTGGIVEIICANPSLQEQYGYLPYEMTLKRFLLEADKRNALMGCFGFNNLEESEELGIFPGHGYTVTDIVRFADDDPEFSYEGVGLYLVRLLNPWGDSEFLQDWKDDDRYGGPWKKWWRKAGSVLRDLVNDDEEEDGEFWISEINLEKHFALVYVCHLGPGQYIGTRDAELNLTTWKTTSFRGEWVKGVTAVGSDPGNRHKLPRYGIELKCPEFAITEQDIGYVVIQLTHRSKNRRPHVDDCPPGKVCKLNELGIYIYQLSTTIRNVHECIGDDFFKTHEIVNREPNWGASDGRAYTLGLYLTCGRYCILPCTHYADLESQFLIRVFSTSRVDQWEYDTKITKSSPLTEENLNYTDPWVHTMFRNIAQDRNEIGWSGLKYIFDEVFNTNQPYFGIFTSVVNYIHDMFTMFSSTRSYNDFGNEEINFTKDQCRSMVAMLDRNHSGKLEISEFVQLWNKINFWIDVYNQYSDETGGYLVVDQLKDALGAIGYDINTRTVHSLRYVYADDEGNILLTDFVLCGVALETSLSRLENEALESDNKMELTLEQWVKYTLIL